MIRLTFRLVFTTLFSSAGAALLVACSDPSSGERLGVVEEGLSWSTGSWSTGSWSSGSGGSGAGGSGSGSFSVPLPIPPVLTPTTTDATTDYYNLTIQTGSTQMKSGNPTPIVGFNGVFPGPTIIATRGRTVKVTQTNGWSENVTIHNHGHKVAASSDGHPTDYILPSASKTYTYPNDQRGGTYWYHDHTMDLTGSHVYRGIAAFYLIHDPAEDSLNLPSGAYDVPLLLEDKQFNSNNTLFYDGTQIRSGFLGDTAVVNGAVTPYFNVEARKYRFRVLNGSNARNFEIALSNNASFKVIASDGGLLASPVTVTSLPVAPAERYDIVIDFASYSVGTGIVLKNSGGDYPSIDSLMQFRVTSTASDSSAVPAQLSSITRFSASQAATTVNLTFSKDNNDWYINGLLYDPSRIDVTSTLNTVYIWKLVNDSGEMHPFHKHLTEFNVLDINGSPPPAAQNGWKDTVAVPDRGSARIIFKDESFTGIYVFHCHKLEHEDHRMMLQEKVQ